MAVWLVVLSGSGIHNVEYTGTTLPSTDNHLIYLFRLECNLNYSVSGELGQIDYTITSGSLPISIILSGATTYMINTHYAYGNYFFTGVTNEALTLTFFDYNDCITGVTLSACTECYSGYTPTYEGTCYKVDSYVAPSTGTTFTIEKQSVNASYSLYGALYFTSWNYNGTGTYERFGLANPYWTNLGSNTGPFNREVVWADTYYNNQDIGFSYCINIGLSKTYYVGFGADNWGKIKLNGEWILQQNRINLRDMFIANGDPVSGDYNVITFRYWYIYPILIPAGDNVLEIFGHNDTNVAGVGIVIYDATKTDLINATSDESLGNKILFQSSSLTGSTLNFSSYITGSTTVYDGYYCADGYALSTCGGGAPTCDKILTLNCGETPTTTTTTTAPP